MLLTKKLTLEEKLEILKELFGYRYENDVLLNRYGSMVDLYKINPDQFDTLLGIINYHAYLARIKGQDDARHEMRKALGI